MGTKLGLSSAKQRKTGDYCKEGHVITWQNSAKAE